MGERNQMILLKLNTSADEQQFYEREKGILSYCH